MSFLPRIKPNDRYLRDFFGSQFNEGDPYQTRPDDIIDFREENSKMRSIPEMIWGEVKENIVDPTLKAFSLPYEGINELSKLSVNALGLNPNENYDVAETLGNILVPQEQDDLTYQFGPMSGLRDSPKIKGALRGTIKSLGRIGLDPTTWTGLGAIDKAPILSKTIGAGFGMMAGSTAYEKFQALGEEGLTDEERAELISSGIIDVGFAGLGLGHAASGLIPKKVTETHIPLRNMPRPEEIQNELRNMDVENFQRGELSKVQDAPIGLENQGDLDVYKNLSPESARLAKNLADQYLELAKSASEDVTAEPNFSQMEGFTSDPESRAKNKRGKIFLNLQALARETSTPEEFVTRIGEVVGHEVEHRDPLREGLQVQDINRPHGEELANRLGYKGADNLEGSNLGEGIGPVVDVEGYNVPIATDADFAFNTRAEATRNKMWSGSENIESIAKPWDENETLAFQRLHDELRGPIGKNKDLSGFKVQGLKEPGSLSKIHKASFEGQDVEVLSRRGNTIKIRLSDGTEKLIGASRLGKASGVETPQEVPKGKYDDLTSELEALEKELGGGENLDQIPETIDPSDVSVVVEDKHILPEDYVPIKRGRPMNAQEVVKPKELLEDVDESGEKKVRRLGDTQSYGEFAGENIETQQLREIERSIKEGKPIEKAQAGEVIKDQGFRDTIKLQDELLKAQELEALQTGKGEEAHKISLERKILRAQNAEEFSTYKREKKEEIQSEKEQIKLQEKILKEQNKEDLVSHEQTERFVGKSEQSETPSGIGETLLDIWRVPAALKSSLDIPALSHSLADTITHPIEAGKNIGHAAKAAWNPTYQEKILTEISKRKNFPVYQKAGVQFTKQGYDPNAQTFGSYTAEKIPGVKASERAQNVFLDKRRADLFDYLTEQMGGSFESNPEGYKKVAELVNAATGYGKLKSQTGEKIITGLNQVMWSARLRLSRLNHLKLLGEAAFSPNMPTPVRKELLKQGIGTVGLGLGLLKLAESLGAEVEDDLRHSQWGKARWLQEDGKYITWNPFAAYNPIVKLISQELSRRKITDKKEFDLDVNKPFNPDRISILGDYAYSGLNPSAKAIFDTISPKTEMDVSPLLSEEFTDEHTNISKMLELVTPINVGNQKQLAEELGPVSALFAPFTTVGANIDVYDPEKFKKQKERSERENPKENKKKGKRKGKVLSSF
jgi:hypothetical protein